MLGAPQEFLAQWLCQALEGVAIAALHLATGEEKFRPQNITLW